jgi:hypothetical protein
MFLRTKMVSNDIEDGVSSFDVEDGVSSFGKPMLHLSPQHLKNGGLNQLGSAKYKLKNRVHMIYHSEDGQYILRDIIALTPFHEINDQCIVDSRWQEP